VLAGLLFLQACSDSGNPAGPIEQVELTEDQELAITYFK